MNEQTRIFIAGSRRLPRLSQDAKHRIGNIMDRGFTVIVGDANGADRAVQQYLSQMGYKKVIIFAQKISVETTSGIGQHARYALKIRPGETLNSIERKTARWSRRPITA